jgi:chromosome partitioning protein
MKRPHIIVLGNEKGGSGKSTTAMHLAVGLLLQGRAVGTIDLDSRQGTFTRYLENRQKYAVAKDVGLPIPQHIAVGRSEIRDPAEAEADERQRLGEALGELTENHEIILIDTPGSDTFLSRLGHSYADTLVTPLNDSFIDLDLLAKVDPDSHEIIGPSIYSEMVWDQRKQRALRDRGSIDWIVMRNRLAHLDARNKRDIADIMERLAKRIGFRLTPGFGERVVFRELFLQGLTLLDPPVKATGRSLTMSQIAARQEVRALVSTVLQGIKPVAEPQAKSA